MLVKRVEALADSVVMVKSNAAADLNSTLGYRSEEESRFTLLGGEELTPPDNSPSS